MATSARALNISWTGTGGNSDWQNAGNWNPFQIPTAGDNVTIDANDTVMTYSTSAPVAFASLTLGDASANFAPTLVLATGTLSAGTLAISSRAALVQASTIPVALSAVTVSSGGQLAHMGNYGLTTRQYILNLSVSGDMTIQAGGLVDANSAGYGPGLGPGAGGSGNDHGGLTGCGAGYGGAGALEWCGAYPNMGAYAGGTYGSASFPDDIGSGGGDGSASRAGNGGGEVMLHVAGTLTVNGTIRANGQAGQPGCCGSQGGGGGGSGGTLSLTTGSLTGTGNITATGGAGERSNRGGGGGPGGGGRILLNAASNTFSGTVAADGGLSNVNNGSPGTIFPFNLQAPVSPYSAVSYNGLTLSWTCAYCTGTTYYAQVSTGVFPNAFTGNLSTSTLNLFYTLSSLNFGTTYYAQVSTMAAGPFVSLGSTMTVPTSQAGPPIGTALGVSSISWTWAASTGAISYNVYLATSPATLVGTVAVSTFVQTGLTSNTVYAVFVTGANSSGQGTPSLPGATTTFAAAPTASAFGPVTNNFLQANWSGNPAGTTYVAILSTGASPSTNGFTNNVASTTLNSFAGFQGTLPSTTYYVDVKAVGLNGVSTAFTALGSTVTLAIPPAAAAFTGVTTAAVQANWTPNSNPAGTMYQAQISTNNFATVNASSFTLNLSVVFGAAGFSPALGLNTTYYLRVQTYTGSNNSVFVSLGSTSTLAVPPVAAAFSGVTTNSLQANWTLGGIRPVRALPPWSRPARPRVPTASPATPALTQRTSSPSSRA